MASTAAVQKEPEHLIACSISRDIQNFELLIEDMETALGENWGDLGYEDATAFFNEPDAAHLKFVALAVGEDDEGELPLIGEIVTNARAKGIHVILVAAEVSPMTLHQLLKLGADDFVPYPLPEGELAKAIERLDRPKGQSPAATAEAETPSKKAVDTDKNAACIMFQGLAGGTGTTTMAVNLAWELATVEREEPPKVCLIDLGLQFGSISTFLDLPRRDIIYEVLSDVQNIDAESFHSALLPYNDTLQVFTAPTDILPLDLITPEDVNMLLDVACASFDYVIIDMPSTLCNWTATCLERSHVYFNTMELDMRSAQNTLRLKQALEAEELPMEKLRYILNRAPKFTDLNGKSRATRLASSLGIDLELHFPDGGKTVTEANDHGMPLALHHAKNPLRREIRKLAKSLHDHNRTAARASA
ncbi:MAG: AAA family ATPase [Halocynthiibacter sp.]